MLVPLLALALTTLTPDDTALVQRATAYLQGLTTAQARFAQTDARGRTQTGTLYLQRPGRARFDYDLPSRVTVASDGHRVVVVDARLQTIRAAPLGFTPLALFLAKDIRFDKSVSIARVTHTPGAFAIVAQNAHKKSDGQIALDFTEQPLALTGWAITDAGSGVVRVKLDGLTRSAPKAANFFELKDPRPVAAAPGAL